jgi:sporulation protein YlmC with PRC-barrel domain
MASPIEDVNRLPGQTVTDQLGKRIGKIKEVYAGDDESDPMWVVVEASTGLAASRNLYVPIARLKEEDGELRVPYSSSHIQNAPDVDVQDELSAEDDRLLRDFYAIDHADQEIRSHNDSYATRVPSREGEARRVTDSVER